MASPGKLEGLPKAEDPGTDDRDIEFAHDRFLFEKQAADAWRRAREGHRRHRAFTSIAGRDETKIGDYRARSASKANAHARVIFYATGAKGSNCF
jgi:hypothetical protein